MNIGTLTAKANEAYADIAAELTGAFEKYGKYTVWSCPENAGTATDTKAADINKSKTLSVFLNEYLV